MNNEPTYSVDEFERESRYIENQIWDTMVIEPGDTVLFCGYGPDGGMVERAIQGGARVSVIEHRDSMIQAFAHVKALLLRGSTSVIPAKDGSFDVTVAFHYLHEVDPFFHAQVVSELARVGKRVCIVEPSPPSDPLGRRIALLYSQAKRELGQFEYYQPMEYWKKLLQAVKVEVAQSVYAFAKVPPREYLDDTIKLILDTMEVEEVPRAYMDELRAIAKRPGSQLLPQARFVLIGAGAGEIPAARPTKREAPKPPERLMPAAAAYEAAQRVFANQPGKGGQQPAAASTSLPPSAAPSWGSPSGEEAQPIMPPPPAPPAPVPSPAPPPLPEPMRAFGLPPPPAPPAATPFGAPPEAGPPAGWGTGEPGVPEVPPFGMPFAMPDAQLTEEPGSPFGLPPMPGRPTGWQWEPPEEPEAETP